MHENNDGVQQQINPIKCANWKHKLFISPWKSARFDSTNFIGAHVSRQLQSVQFIVSSPTTFECSSTSPTCIFRSTRQQRTKTGKSFVLHKTHHENIYSTLCSAFVGAVWGERVTFDSWHFLCLVFARIVSRQSKRTLFGQIEINKWLFRVRRNSKVLESDQLFSVECSSIRANGTPQHV